MNQNKNKKPEQVLYLGRYVDKDTFRAFVYSKEGDETLLANNYKEFEDFISNGDWVAEKSDKKVVEIDIKPKLKKN